MQLVIGAGNAAHRAHDVALIGNLVQQMCGISGADFDYIVPDDTLLIENPGTVLIDAKPAATQWLDFVLSDQAQEIFGETGFRPLNGKAPARVEGANDPENPFPQPQRLYTIANDFGSWEDLSKTFFAEQTGIVTQLLAELGKS